MTVEFFFGLLGFSNLVIFIIAFIVHYGMCGLISHSLIKSAIPCIFWTMTYIFFMVLYLIIACLIKYIGA